MIMGKTFDDKIKQTQDAVDDLNAATSALQSTAKKASDSIKDIVTYVVKGRNPVASIPVTKPFKRKYPKVGRNELCPCGSKIKFKRCHGRNA